MRVLQLVPNLNFGGLQEVASGLSVGLTERGHSVAVASWFGRSNHPEVELRLTRAGVDMIVLFASSQGRVQALRKLRACFASGQFDILHVHNREPEYYFWGALLARLAGVPVVINTVHATVVFERLSMIQTAMFRVATKMTSRMVSVSRESNTIPSGLFPRSPERLDAVENGLELSSFLAIPSRQLHDDIVFGAVGRMTPVKNHALLIEAFAAVVRKYPGVRLRLLGGGSLEATLRRQVADLGISGAVEFCGFSHDVAGFLASIDVFVLSSNSEGLPLSLLEAIAAGLPVIGTEVGGVPGVVRASQGGWLCPPRNPAAMATAMEAAIQSPDRLSKAEQARHFVAEHYSVSRMTADYEQLYRNLLSQVVRS